MLNAPRLWWLGVRPRTLTIAVSPVLLGGGLAYFDGNPLDWILLTVTLVSAIAIQAGTNLYNDAADGERGNDSHQRLGPPRLTGQGWATPRDVRQAAFLCFALAGLGGLYLVRIGGWPILLIGLLSLLSGYAYSAGRRPISHLPVGELFVIAFFGLAAVGGTYLLQTGRLSANAVLAGLAVGCFAAAVLLVNNSRDRIEDGRAGRRTLAILAGPRLSVMLYGLFMLTPFVQPLAIGWAERMYGAWLPLLLLPMAVLAVRRFGAATGGPDFNRLLALTAKLQLAFVLLYLLGLAGAAPMQ